MMILSVLYWPVTWTVLALWLAWTVLRLSPRGLGALGRTLIRLGASFSSWMRHGDWATAHAWHEANTRVAPPPVRIEPEQSATDGRGCEDAPAVQIDRKA
jgi:hypothetical protein